MSQGCSAVSRMSGVDGGELAITDDSVATRTGFGTVAALQL